jgi:8-oxo-dGTP diphosphatase
MTRARSRGAGVVARYAGVLALHDGDVALVREEYPAWGGEFWNVPSGRVEDGETPAEGAARELAEETGLVVTPEDLTLVSTVTTSYDGVESHAWNHVVEAATTELVVDDPDGIIREACWFPREEAIALLSALPYPPLSEPAVAYLRGEAPPGTHWTFGGDPGGAGGFGGDGILDP